MVAYPVSSVSGSQVDRRDFHFFSGGRKTQKRKEGEEGITGLSSVRFSYQQNILIRRSGKTLPVASCCILIDKRMPRFLEKQFTKYRSDCCKMSALRDPYLRNFYPIIGNDME